MKTFKELIEAEDINDEYVAKEGDLVKPLPFVSSQRIGWESGIVTRVFEDGPTPEIWITTSNNRKIIEYMNYVYPLSTPTSMRQGNRLEAFTDEDKECTQQSSLLGGRSAQLQTFLPLVPKRILEKNFKKTLDKETT